MHLKQAQKVFSDYGGFIECAFFRFHTVFLGIIPESLLPYSVKYIEEAFNIVAKYYHDKGDKKSVELLQRSIGWLLWFEDDEKAILEAVKNFNEKKMYDLIVELIKGFRGTQGQKNYISGFFTDIHLEKVDFENPDFSTAHKIVEIYSIFLKYAHMRLSFIFCQKIPESLLPFPKKHLVKALDACSIGDDKNIEVYTSGKTILEEDYVDDEVAMSELIKNFSDKEMRDSIISDIKDFQLR